MSERLTKKDLDRLERNGIGGMTTIEEYQKLIKMAREALKPAESPSLPVDAVVMQPCPFCGGDATITTVHHPRTMDVIGYNGMCVDCRALGAEGETESEATENWNSRVV